MNSCLLSFADIVLVFVTDGVLFLLLHCFLAQENGPHVWELIHQRKIKASHMSVILLLALPIQLVDLLECDIDRIC